MKPCKAFKFCVVLWEHLHNCFFVESLQGHFSLSQMRKEKSDVATVNYLDYRRQEHVILCVQVVSVDLDRRYIYLLILKLQGRGLWSKRTKQSILVISGNI